MALTPRARRFALTAHIVSSVGWLGAVVVYLVLAVTALTGHDAQTVRAVYPAMELTVGFVIVPASLVSLLTGVICSLGTAWGLLRHYWVLAKLLLTVLATPVLLMYARSIGHVADVTTRTSPSGAVPDALRDPTHALHSGGGLLVLLAATALAVYKPRGMTGYGLRARSRAS
ncbi:membrane protein [Streptomyces megasporus]|uniref:membrane protein n=1 Tax=Streptomyces megasporus TaxID=44060 RepID=UPI0004E22341|nr:membrane protein [Streptomyces megasporus]